MGWLSDTVESMDKQARLERADSRDTVATIATTTTALRCRQHL